MSKDGVLEGVRDVRPGVVFDRVGLQLPILALSIPVPGPECTDEVYTRRADQDCWPAIALLEEPFLNCA
jgi:hypothetical protein